MLLEGAIRERVKSVVSFTSAQLPADIASNRQIHYATCSGCMGNMLFTKRLFGMIDESMNLTSTEFRKEKREFLSPDNSQLGLLGHRSNWTRWAK